MPYTEQSDGARFVERFADGTERDITDELPFEIPASWEWVRLRFIGEIVTGSTPKTSISGYYGDEYCFFKPTDLDAGDNVIASNDMLSKLGYKKSRQLPPNSILVTCIGATIGKTGMTRIEGTCNQQINAIIPFQTATADYLYFCCISEYFQQSIKLNASSTTLPILNKSKFSDLMLPLPPIAEQHRIVERLEELLPHIADYDVAEQKLTALNTTFPERLKKSILQAAVRGKLVDQDPNDEPASVLLERIRDEKAALVKAGKIKKSKQESVIFRRDNSHYEKLDGIERCIDDEIPFEIPDSWKWTRLGMLIQLTSGQDMTPDKYCNTKTGIPYLTGASTIVNGEVIINRWTIVPKSIALKDDLLITCKGTVGAMAFLECEQAHIARQIMSIRSMVPLNKEYLFYFLETYVTTLKSAAKSMIPGIARDDVLNALFPLPPLAEQHRIVERIDELSPLRISL